jgi:anti-sigma B factor antagonist
MHLKIDTYRADGIMILECSGRLVFGEETAALRDQVKDLVAAGKKQIVLELGGISHIDSGGLGTLVALYATARNASGTIKLANLTQMLGELLVKMCLHRARQRLEAALNRACAFSRDERGVFVCEPKPGEK